MSNYQTLLVEKRGHVLQVQINRPQALNALNSQVLDDLSRLIDEAGRIEDVRCMLLTGAGEKAFVAGADLKEIDQLDFAQALSFARKGQNVFRRLELLPFPVVAGVHGFALGGGFELALSCDFIIATEKARFGLPESGLGLLPGFGGTVRLPRRLGLQLAKEMALTGEMIGAEQAHTLGLVNRVVPQEEFRTACDKVVEQLTRRGPVALRLIKRSINEGCDRSVDEALELEASLFQELFSTEDQKEGVRAFIEKREPVFKGR